MSSVPKARFTHHAYLRIVGGDGEERRLKLSPEEVVAILDGDKAVPVGRDPSESHKIHRAFYSTPDDECFIAVQDERNGEVITLLPFSHHKRFVVDPVHVRKMAMELPGTSFYSLPELPDVVAGPDAHLVVVMEVECPTLRSGKRPWIQRLLRTPFPEGSLLHEVAREDTLQKDAELEGMRWLHHQYPTGSQIAGFRLHFVSHGTISDFRWFEKDWTPRKRAR